MSYLTDLELGSYWNRAFTYGYTFPSPSLNDGVPSEEKITSIGAINSDNYDDVTAAFQAWKNVANISVSYSATSPDISLGTGSIPGGLEGWTWDNTDSGPLSHSEIYLRTGITSYPLGEEGGLALLHEIGHALGLRHPAGDEHNPDYSQDTTIMVYDAGTITSGAIPVTPMIYDIATIQAIYGANFTYNSSGSSYAYDDTVSQALTIWDGGGNDTLDASTVSGGVTLDLRAGFDGNDNQYVSHIGDTYVFMAYHANIENAIGSDGNDTIYGNDSVAGETIGVSTYAAFSGANSLVGGDGDDYLVGNKGTDTLVGGSGDDTYVFNPNDGKDTVIDSDGSGTLVFDGASITGTASETDYDTEVFTLTSGGIDFTIHRLGADISILNSETNDEILLKDYTLGKLGLTLVEQIYDDETFFTNSDTYYREYHIVNTSGTSFTATEYETYNYTVLSSTSFTGSLTGVGGGNGCYIYFAGGTNAASYATAATLNGSAYDDAIVVEGAGAAHLYGLAGDDNLSGGAGNDYIEGGNDDDTINGGSGADTILGGSGDDEIVGSPFAGIPDSLDGGSGDDYIQAYDGTVTGGVGFDTIVDSGGNCYIDGGDDDDFIDATGSNNTIVGGDGDDYISFVGDNISIVGGDGYDQVRLNTDSALTLTLNEDGSITSNMGSNIIIADMETFEASDYNDLITGNSQDNNLIGDDGNDTISGGGGDDYIVGGAGADSLIGGTGTNTLSYVFSSAAVNISLLANTYSGGDAAGDTVTGFQNLLGSANNDTLIGDTANNAIDGNEGNDTLLGGDGNDTLVGWDGADTLNGGNGTDVANYSDYETGIYINLSNTSTGGDATGDVFVSIERFIGSQGNDTLVGDSNTNYFTGLSGNDTMNGGDGNDTLASGLGADTLNGGNGNDLAYYGDSSAAISINLATGVNTGGDAASDVLISIESITGSANNDTLTGDSLGNYFDGGNGADTISGGDGADTLYGGSGNDTVIGGVGNDVISDSAGANYLDGGDGNDTITGSSGGSSDTLIGGIGNDVIDAAGGGNYIDGGDGADTLYGGAGSPGDSIYGGDGGDIIYGRAGDDLISGGNGDDDLHDSTGTDTFDGGSGSDHVRYDDAASGIVADLSNYANNTGLAAGDVFISIENLWGSNYNDTLSGDSLGNEVHGRGGNDVMYGNSGNDLLYDESGSDTVYGGDGSDYMYAGSSGTDVYDGGNGSDYVLYTTSSAAVNVDLSVGTGSGGDAAGDTYANIEGVYGSTFNDTLTGGSGGEYFNGWSGNDIIFANGGADYIDGSTGIDTIYGGTGVDTINGQGSGDFFAYTSAGESGVGSGNRDKLLDFSQSEGDKLDLSAVIAGTFTFRGTSAFTGAADEVRYTQTGGNTIIAVDSDHDGTTNFEIEITGHTYTMVSGDFVL